MMPTIYSLAAAFAVCATVQFSEGLGDYTFLVTVTNGNGASAKKTVTVTYLGR